MVLILEITRNLQIIPLASNALIILLQEMQLPYWEAQLNLPASAMPTITEVAKHRVRHVELAASVMVNQILMLQFLLLASALLTHTGLMARRSARLVLMDVLPAVIPDQRVLAIASALEINMGRMIMVHANFALLDQVVTLDLTK